MSSKRFEGKNLEEALDSAASSFGVERYRISYHVVLEKRGFLGGTKRVVIEAEVSDTPVGRSESPKEPKPARKQSEERKPQREKQTRKEPRSEDRRPEPEDAPEKKPSVGNREGDDRGPRKGRGRRRGRRGRGGRSGERNGDSRQQDDSRQRDDARQRDDSYEEPRKSEPVEIPEQGNQSPDAAKVAEWCSEVFRLSGLDLVPRTTESDEEISVELFGSDVSLIDEGVADYLDSLQVLANKSFTGRSFERRIEFDAAGFKERREQELRERALELAARVREDGREKTMRAMSPIERRIVHVTLEEERGVTTESRGRGFHKRVAIIPVDDDERASAADA